jgi:hypothetical protein
LDHAKPRPRSPRWQFIAASFKRLFTFAGLKALFLRPRVTVEFFRAVLFDVKLKSTPASSENISLHNSIDALARLAQTHHKTVIAVGIAQAVPDVSQDQDCIDLASLFCSHGSDKASTHNYHLVYAALLKDKRHEPIHILEIGLGTNNIDIASNMGRAGRPGASLRAFRDWAPSAHVAGADIDRRILFTEDRIATFFVDQTSPDTIDALARNFPPRSLDLVIDDGLHTPEANLNACAGLIGLVKAGGWMVIEDVNPEALPYWQIVFSALSPSFRCTFVTTKACCMCLLQRTAT